ncbi:hypothetical protein EVAR_54663_1 [Eumeta japonica]|uniref:Uncharacterized protein n=1 Tax=Eumeta variegata TaxID=151549 RepID=A0A4C1XAE1_EUMVA|nr:hypothetical protein EVAR_54663_1 [Eumeta japonica]
MPDRLILTIQNFVSNQHFTFRHERTHSTRRLIRAGVPQGSALSPSCTRVHLTYRVQRSASSSRSLPMIPRSYLESGTRRSIFRHHLPRAIIELGQWFEVADRGVTLDKMSTFESTSRGLEECAFYLLAGLDPCSVEKAN